jgi:hypothetical protein
MGLLKKLTKLSGGIVYEFRRPGELERATDLITREIRSQYSLTYTPSNQTPKGGSRNIAVRVEPPDRKKVTVRTRTSYVK